MTAWMRLEFIEDGEEENGTLIVYAIEKSELIDIANDLYLSAENVAA